MIQTETLDQLYLEWSQFTEARTKRELKLLKAVQLAYRKWHLDDPNVGSNQLSEALLHAICEAIGDEGYQEWMKSIGHGEK